MPANICNPRKLYLNVIAYDINVFQVYDGVNCIIFQFNQYNMHYHFVLFWFTTRVGFFLILGFHCFSVISGLYLEHSLIYWHVQGFSWCGIIGDFKQFLGQKSR